MKTLATISACTLLLLAAPVAADTVDVEGLGRIDFPNSGAPEAQDAFRRAVLLLHNFEYEDAREAFREAREIDPAFALAYWGEAMTHNHPLWRRQGREAAREALGRLAPSAAERRAKAPTERERGYLETVEILFGEGDKVSRDLAYSEALRRLSQRYPEDLDAKSFYALSILGTAQGVRDFAVYMRAGAVAEEVFAQNPRHPGAAHYLIHSYDDPVHAPLGLRAARVYAEIAPDASHAQHMISHIYVALGWWAEAGAANVKSVAVSEKRLERKDLPLHQRNHHSLHWLEYSYLQEGRYQDAAAQLAVMEKDAAASAVGNHRWYLAYMRAGYAVATGRWDAVAADVDTADLSVAPGAAQLYAQGAAALARGERAAAEKILEKLGTRRREAEKAALEDDRATGRDSPTDLKAALVMERELAGLVALDAGAEDKALELLAAAAEAEEAMALAFGPPLVVKPSHELYGEVLLRLGRPGEARTRFEKALGRAPRRSASLLGLYRATRALGDTDAARRHAAELTSIWRHADPGVGGLDEVQDTPAATR